MQNALHTVITRSAAWAWATSGVCGSHQFKSTGESTDMQCNRWFSRKTSHGNTHSPSTKHFFCGGQPGLDGGNGADVVVSDAGFHGAACGEATCMHGGCRWLASWEMTGRFVLISQSYYIRSPVGGSKSFIEFYRGFVGLNCPSRLTVRPSPFGPCTWIRINLLVLQVANW